jgi:hypothetical protein
LRTRRIALANERLPPRLRALMLFMSTTLVGAFVFLGVQGTFAHIYMLVTLTVSIHLRDYLPKKGKSPLIHGC